MKVRAPKMTYDTVDPHWGPHLEFVAMQNAASLMPAHIEPYLFKVLAMAKKELERRGVKNDKLARDMDIFFKQEMQHCKHHIAFNNRLKETRYPGLADIEKDYAVDYERFLKQKSLVWNLAYSEGFESLSAVGSLNYFENFDEYWEGADPKVVEMWKWHLAEEYEHREVAYDVLHALSGRNPLMRYLWRVYGFIVANVHIRAYHRRFIGYLMSVDRRGMSPAEIDASNARFAKLKRDATRIMFSEYLSIMLPFYKPAKRRPPRGWADYLATFDERQAAYA